MTQYRRIACAGVVCLALAACQTEHPPAPGPGGGGGGAHPCPAGSPPPTAEILFQRVTGAAPGAGVSEKDFSVFLNDEVATRFHDGLTVTDEQGGSGSKFYGPLKRVTIVLSGRSDDAAQVEAIRAAYTARFHKETGLDMSRAECGAP